MKKLFSYILVLGLSVFPFMPMLHAMENSSHSTETIHSCHETKELHRAKEPSHVNECLKVTEEIGVYQVSFDIVKITFYTIPKVFLDDIYKSEIILQKGALAKITSPPENARMAFALKMRMRI